MNLNLGCGKKKLTGYINIDMVSPADLIMRVGKDKFPYKDGEVDRIEADNLMEHLDNDEFLFAMNECHRVLKDGGEFYFVVPDALHWFDGAFGDPTHKRYFTTRSFNYFTDHPTYHVYGSSYGFKMFKLKELRSDGRFFYCTLTK